MADFPDVPPPGEELPALKALLEALLDRSFTAAEWKTTFEDQLETALEEGSISSYDELDDFIAKSIPIETKKPSEKELAFDEFADALKARSLIDHIPDPGEGGEPTEQFISSDAYLLGISATFDELYADYVRVAQWRSGLPFIEWAASDIASIPTEVQLRQLLAQETVRITGRSPTPEQLAEILADPHGLEKLDPEPFGDAFKREAPALSEDMSLEDVTAVKQRLQLEFGQRVAAGEEIFAGELIQARFTPTFSDIQEERELLLTTPRRTFQQEAQRAAELRLAGRDEEARRIDEQITFGGPPAPRAIPEDELMRLQEGIAQREAALADLPEGEQPSREEQDALARGREAVRQQTVANALASGTGAAPESEFDREARLTRALANRPPPERDDPRTQRGILAGVVGRETDAGFREFLAGQFGASSSDPVFQGLRREFQQEALGASERRQRAPRADRAAITQPTFADFIARHVGELRTEFDRPGIEAAAKAEATATAERERTQRERTVAADTAARERQQAVGRRQRIRGRTPSTTFVRSGA
tara:strand:- start:251 stop:1867 length:1617 start_codon:yes stop_codon:yes gene_type:complete